MAGYSAREVARLLEVPVARVRALVRAGFGPGRGLDELTFQDVVLLRTAKGLLDAKIAPGRVRRVLERLRAQLPSGRPLTGVAIAAEGNKVIVRDDGARWNPESGQVLFDFDVKELARKAAPLLALKAKQARRAEAEQSAEDWYELGCNLEVTSPSEARDAYRRAVELDPHNAAAHVNLGRLLHEARELDAARAHYELALAARPADPIAAFNLAVVLEDLGRAADAVAAYERALAVDPGCADAHYNLARLLERADPTAALRHLKAYRKLTEGR